jgi:hypothetical protein
VLTLREEGILLALDGKTCLEEVLSVTHSEDTSAQTAKPVGAASVPAEVA